MHGLAPIFLTPRLGGWTCPRTDDNSGLVFQPRRKRYEQSTFCANDAREPWKVQLKHVSIQEQHASKRLILRGC